MVRGGLSMGRIAVARRSLTLLVGALLLVPRAAAAAVTQPPPGGEVMPQATGATEIALVTSRGFSSDAVTLSGLFKYFAGGADGALDPVNDASTTPGSFSPQCGLKAEIVLKGGACSNALGCAPEGDLSLRSACEYLVCEHSVPGLPINANPTRPPVQFGLVRIAGSNAGSGLAQPCWGAWVVVLVASGQKSESEQARPFGGAKVRLAGTTG
jgi:hypothetical protein